MGHKVRLRTPLSCQHDLGTYVHENNFRILFWTESSIIGVGDDWRMFMAAVQKKSFTGKVALVTGGSRGIGAGIVRRLAANGASVAFTYSSSPEKPLHLLPQIESHCAKPLPLTPNTPPT